MDCPKCNMWTLERDKDGMFYCNGCNLRVSEDWLAGWRAGIMSQAPGEIMEYHQVWSEGFQATGQRCEAMCHGSFPGETFKDAVKAFSETLSEEDNKDYIDMERLTYWGCRFFDNAKDAQRSFG